MAWICQTELKGSGCQGECQQIDLPCCPLTKAPNHHHCHCYHFKRVTFWDRPLLNERWSGYSQQRLLAFLTNKVYTNSVITLNKLCRKEESLCFTMMGEMPFNQETDRGGYCETHKHRSWLAWKFPSRAQSFLWQRLMPKPFWVPLSLYNNYSTSCIWPIVQWDTTGRVSIPAPAGDEFSLPAWGLRASINSHPASVPTDAILMLILKTY